jgi:hypothetical protein
MYVTAKGYARIAYHDPPQSGYLNLVGYVGAIWAGLTTVLSLDDDRLGAYHIALRVLDLHHQGPFEAGQCDPFHASSKSNIIPSIWKPKQSSF